MIRLKAIQLDDMNFQLRSDANDFSDFRMLVPSDPGFLDTNYNFSRSGSNNFFNSKQYRLSLAFSPYSKVIKTYLQNREIRIGLCYRSGMMNEIHFFTDASWSVDTFKIEDHHIFKDSFYTKRLSFTNQCDILNLEFSYIFSSTPLKWMTLYAGLGFSAGLTYNTAVSKTFLSDSGYYYHDSPFDKTGFYYRHNFIYSFEETGAKGALLFGPQLPLGISLKITDNNSVLGRFSLYFEGKIGLEFQFVSGGNANINKISGYGMGIRYNLI